MWQEGKGKEALQGFLREGLPQELSPSAPWQALCLESRTPRHVYTPGFLTSRISILSYPSPQAKKLLFLSLLLFQKAEGRGPKLGHLRFREVSVQTPPPRWALIHFRWVTLSKTAASQARGLTLGLPLLTPPLSSLPDAIVRVGLLVHRVGLCRVQGPWGPKGLVSLAHWRLRARGTREFPDRHSSNK